MIAIHLSLAPRASNLDLWCFFVFQSEPAVEQTTIFHDATVMCERFLRYYDSPIGLLERKCHFNKSFVIVLLPK